MVCFPLYKKYPEQTASPIAYPSLHSHQYVAEFVEHILPLQWRAVKTVKFKLQVIKWQDVFCWASTL